MVCDKLSYETPKDAHDGLIGLRQRYKKHKYSVYKCSNCPYYHIATITKRILRPFKKEKYPIEIYSRTEPKQKHKSKKKKK